MSVGGTSRPSGFAVLSLRSLDDLRRPSSVEKLQPKEPQTWKTTRRVGKSFANGMALPKDKRQTADQAAAFAKRAVEQNEFQRSSREPYHRIMGWLLSLVGRS